MLWVFCRLLFYGDFLHFDIIGKDQQDFCVGLGEREEEGGGCGQTSVAIAAPAKEPRVPRSSHERWQVGNALGLAGHVLLGDLNPFFPFLSPSPPFPPTPPCCALIAAFFASHS